jgi:hypothetical protein
VDASLEGGSWTSILTCVCSSSVLPKKDPKGEMTFLIDDDNYDNVGWEKRRIREYKG